MANVINAIFNLVNNPIYELNQEYVNYRNRANSSGDALEEYVLDAFAGSINDDESIRMLKISETFSYKGNASNPPDAMLWKGDAIEVKKLESKTGQIQLNSSYPKHKLVHSNELLTYACRKAEEDVGGWVEKDMLYVFGLVNNGKLKELTMVYGEDYAASIETYANLKTNIANEINNIPGVEFSPTRELGRINNVDPLGITNLRIRGMWLIDNPRLVFSYLNMDTTHDFNLNVIINKDKWSTLENRQQLLNLVELDERLFLKDVKIKDTNNPAKLKDAKLISYGYDEE